MSASSFSVNHGPSQGRLNVIVGRGKKGPWCSRSKDQNQYLQVDFWRSVKLTNVATQCRQDYSQWVTHYKLSYAVDGSTVFQIYQEMGVDKVRGNVCLLRLIYLLDIFTYSDKQSEDVLASQDEDSLRLSTNYRYVDLNSLKT